MTALVSGAAAWRAATPTLSGEAGGRAVAPADASGRMVPPFAAGGRIAPAEVVAACLRAALIKGSDSAGGDIGAAGDSAFSTGLMGMKSADPALMTVLAEGANAFALHTGPKPVLCAG